MGLTQHGLLYEPRASVTFCRTINYHVAAKEMLSIVYAIKHFNHWLIKYMSYWLDIYSPEPTLNANSLSPFSSLTRILKDAKIPAIIPPKT